MDTRVKPAYDDLGRRGNLPLDLRLQRILDHAIERRRLWRGLVALFGDESVAPYERMFECSFSYMKSSLASSRSICASIAVANCGMALSKEKSSTTTTMLIFSTGF
jgi:hypothetical protein